MPPEFEHCKSRYIANEKKLAPLLHLRKGRERIVSLDDMPGVGAMRPKTAAMLIMAACQASLMV